MEGGKGAWVGDTALDKRVFSCKEHAEQDGACLQDKLTSGSAPQTSGPPPPRGALLS